MHLAACSTHSHGKETETIVEGPCGSIFARMLIIMLERRSAVR